MAARTCLLGTSRLGTSGTSRGTYRCLSHCLLCVGGREDAASSLSSRASSWHPEPPSPRSPGAAGWLRGRCSLVARWVLPLCPAAPPVCHLLLLPCWPPDPFFRVAADALLVGLSPVACHQLPCEVVVLVLVSGSEVENLLISASLQAQLSQHGCTEVNGSGPPASGRVCPRRGGCGVLLVVVGLQWT